MNQLATGTLPAISLWQPWASLIAWGEKRYETRSWSTRHRGPMAIHAGLRWTVRMALRCYAEPFFTLMCRHGIRFPARCDATSLQSLGLPLGVVLCVAELVDCRPAGDVLREIGGKEEAFGDFSHGRWAWEYRDVRRIVPVPCTGRQGLFRLPAEVQAAVMAQLAGGGS